MSLINAAIAGFSKVNLIQLEALRWLAITLVVVVAGVVGAGVFFRYVLNDSLSWSEEAAKYAMLWMVFLAAPIALRLGGHPSIQLLVHTMPRRLGAGVRAIVALAVVVFCAYLAWKSHAYAWSGRKQIAIAIGDVSMYAFYVSIPVGMASMTLVSIQLFFEELRNFLSGREHPPDPVVVRFMHMMEDH